MIKPIYYIFFKPDNSTRDMPTWAIKFVISPRKERPTAPVLDQQIDIYKRGELTNQPKDFLW